MFWKDHKCLFHAFFLNLALIVRWATDVYEFNEGEIAAVELVTDSNFEVDQISIQGFPKAIHDTRNNQYPELLVPGPVKDGKSDLFSEKNLQCIII